jgi:cardiolipin synthase
MSEGEPVLTLPNQLTLLRMGLSPVVVVLVLSRELRLAFWCFVAAAVTDLLDGQIARRRGQQTKLGAMLDPVADKMLLSLSFVALTWSAAVPRPIPHWLTVIVLARDAIVLGAAIMVTLAQGARPFPPSALGKAATAAQLVTVSVVLFANAFDVALPGIRALFVATLALTVVSAVDYAVKGARG